jgi:hypothetical protein
MALAALALLAAIVFIAVRSGPLAATRITVVTVAEASLSPACSAPAPWRPGAPG